jgi:prefoldin subunit 5
MQGTDGKLDQGKAATGEGIMTNTGQPPTIEQRLSRLENIFVGIGETVVAQSDTIDVLVANINQLTENVNRLNNGLDNLTIAVNRSTANIEALTAQAAQDRQQAAIDRQEFRSEIRRIWEYLRDRNGGSTTPEAS